MGPPPVATKQYSGHAVLLAVLVKSEVRAVRESACAKPTSKSRTVATNCSAAASSAAGARGASRRPCHGGHRARGTSCRQTGSHGRQANARAITHPGATPVNQQGHVPRAQAMLPPADTKATDHCPAARRTRSQPAPVAGAGGRERHDGVPRPPRRTSQAAELGGLGGTRTKATCHWDARVHRHILTGRGGWGRIAADTG